jgi:hypothetical protein
MMRTRLAGLSARATRPVRRRTPTRPYLESLEQQRLLAHLEIVQSSFLLTTTFKDKMVWFIYYVPLPSITLPSFVPLLLFIMSSLSLFRPTVTARKNPMRRQVGLADHLSGFWRFFLIPEYWHTRIAICGAEGAD